MRDKRFIAEHRGGPLKKEQHRQLMKWACDCVEHILSLVNEAPDDRLKDILSTGRDWAEEKINVGEARKASLKAISIANQSADPVAIAVVRSAGHAVATAHMADHSLGAVYYALKATKAAGKSTDEERNWQNNHLPAEIKELILTARISRIDKYFNFTE